jgi:hypothetical protein
MHRKFYPENLNGRMYLGDLDVNRRMLLKWILKKQGVMVLTALKWLRVGSSGGLFLTRKLTFESAS